MEAILASILRCLALAWGDSESCAHAAVLQGLKVQNPLCDLAFTGIEIGRAHV